MDTSAPLEARHEGDSAGLGFVATPRHNEQTIRVILEPTKATIYLYNASGLASATNAIAHIPEAWDGRALI
jgi:hypothetical protein